LPDRDTLVGWLEAAGYVDVRLVDENQTTLEEQRQTEWMRFYSLKQALDPEDLNRTIEGHPAPLRAALTARYQPR
jgi:tRNA (mo5U34)-methyltransferase